MYFKIESCFILKTTDFYIIKHSNGVSRTWYRSRDVSQDPFFGVSVSVSKVPGLVLVSKYFGLGLELLVSRFCIGYFV